MRWTPILALLGILLLAPGVLGHHCNFGSDRPQSGDGFNVQSTAAPTVPIALIVGLLLIPAVVAGVLAVAVRRAGKAPGSGRWVWTPQAWVFVPDRK